MTESGQRQSRVSVHSPMPTLPADCQFSLSLVSREETFANAFSNLTHGEAVSDSYKLSIPFRDVH